MIVQLTKQKYTNNLIYESSPYLQQHAYNPVNWYAWGNEAFERITPPLPLSSAGGAFYI